MAANFQFRLTGSTPGSSFVRMEVEGAVPNAFALHEILATATALFLGAGAHLPRVQLRPEDTDNVPNSPQEPPSDVR
ncbi:hypothetical protein LCGC14_2759040 [marine sediment metagenome]|uniref:Uncharacterized protein n=1 Tax=marine sediment metagenome TaxID=412755 RepID=A0A0F8YZL9_9ZZZZ